MLDRASFDGADLTQELHATISPGEYSLRIIQPAHSWVTDPSVCIPFQWDLRV